MAINNGLQVDQQNMQVKHQNVSQIHSQQRYLLIVLKLQCYFTLLPGKTEKCQDARKSVTLKVLIRFSQNDSIELVKVSYIMKI